MRLTESKGLYYRQDGVPLQQSVPREEPREDPEWVDTRTEEEKLMDAYIELQKRRSDDPEKVVWVADE